MPDPKKKPNGAVGGNEDEPGNNITNATEIYDIRPQTVGLVTRGANRRAFFLAKKEGDNMPDDINQDELPAELAEAVMELELAGDPENESDTDERAAEETRKQKSKQSAFAKLAQAVDIVLEKRPRDPVVAAQRALALISGHMDLNDAAKFLLDYLSAHNAQPTTPTPAKPSPPVPPEPYGTPPAKRTKKEEFPAPGAGERSDTGTFSVAQGDPNMPEPTVPQTTPPDLMATITQALEPFLTRLEAMGKEVDLVKQFVQMQGDKAAQSALIPLAKSTGVPVQTLGSLQKGLSADEFTKVVDEMSRMRRALASGMLFSEVGTSAGAGEVPSNEILLMKKADEIRKEDKGLDFAAAVVRASEIMGLSLEPAASISREGE